MRFRIHLTSRAERELRGILEWIEEQTERGAIRLAQAFDATLDLLAKNPANYALAPESSFVSFEVRQCFFKTRRGRNYRILFEIRDDTVYVLHVRGPNQNLIDTNDLRYE